MVKFKHFDLLYNLFIDSDGNVKHTWRSITLGTRNKHRWPTLREYILSNTHKKQYKEFLYLLQHNCEIPKCKACGKELSYDNGYKTYCSRKCARKNQIIISKPNDYSNIDFAVTIINDDLSLYDNYINDLCVYDGKTITLTKLYNIIRVSNDIKYANIRYWLKNRIPWAKKNTETLYCLCHDIKEQPVCKICNKPVTFRSLSHGYNKYCSSSCAGKDDVLNDIRKEKLMQNIDIFKKKISDGHRRRTAQQKQEAVEKHKDTLLKKYGDENYHNVDQMKQTNLEKGGHICSLHWKEKAETYDNSITDIGRQKISLASKERWSDIVWKKKQINRLKESHKQMSENTRESKVQGYKKWLNGLSDNDKKEWCKNISDGVRNWAQNRSTEDIINKLQKEYITKKQNGTFNISLPEQQCEEYIKKYFNGDYITQYKSVNYPYSCDFYIPSLDTYIEYQGTWTHGGHPYDPNNNDDRQIIEKWNNKDTFYYKNAIHTWTVSDVKKRQVASDNNLHWYEVWNIDEFKHIINTLYEQSK